MGSPTEVEMQGFLEGKQAEWRQGQSGEWVTREKAGASGRSGEDQARTRILVPKSGWCFPYAKYILQKIEMQCNLDHIEHWSLKCKCKKMQMQKC
jgi:hypothetical protein